MVVLQPIYVNNNNITSKQNNIMIKKNIEKGIVYVKSTHRGNSTIWAGTINHLNTTVFGYSLECGHSWNSKISINPKGVKSLVNALNKSADECRRYHDHYEVSTRDEYFNEGGTLTFDDSDNTYCGHVSL